MGMSSLTFSFCDVLPRMCVQVSYHVGISRDRCSTRLRNSSSCGWREKGGTRGRQTIDGEGEREGQQQPAGGWLQSDEPLPSICLVNQLEKSTQPTDYVRTNAVQCFSTVNAHLESLAMTHHSKAVIKGGTAKLLKTVIPPGPYCT